VNRVAWLALAWLAWGAPLSAEPVMRVRVLAGVPSVRLAGEELRVAGDRVRSPSLLASARAGAIRLGAQPHHSPLRIDGARGVLVNGDWYPGGLLLHAAPRDRLDVINMVRLEEYVERIVASEVYASWPDEVLKAQAVAARSYALHQQAERAGEAWDVEGNVLSQSYRDRSPRRRVRRATEETRGRFLSFAGAPILAAYHSSAGGRTAAADEVWGDAVPYLVSVESPDDEAPDHFWSYEIPLDDLLAALREAGADPGASREVAVVERWPSGRVRTLQLGEASVSGREFRQILGGRAIKSALFEARVEDGVARFLGSGAGHGVGLSQWGALQLARQGKRWEEILSHYYPGAELTTLNGARP
jgi:stage II sporulation protein D